jgi:hypothetical protein
VLLHAQVYKFAGVETPGSSGMFNITVEYCPSAKIHVLKAATVPPSMPRIIADYMSAPESLAANYPHSAPSAGSHFIRGAGAAAGGVAVAGGRGVGVGEGVMGRQCSMPAAAGAAGVGSGRGAAGGSLPGSESGFLQGSPGGGILRLGGTPLGASPPVVRHTWSSRDMPARVVQRGFNPRTPTAGATAGGSAPTVAAAAAAGGAGGVGSGGGPSAAGLHRSVSVPSGGSAAVLGTSAGKPPLPHCALLGGGASPTTPRSLPRYGLRGSMSSGGVGHVGLVGGNSPGRGHLGNSPLMGVGGSPGMMGRGGSPLAGMAPLNLDDGRLDVHQQQQGQRQAGAGNEGGTLAQPSPYVDAAGGVLNQSPGQCGGSGNPLSEASGKVSMSEGYGIRQPQFEAPADNASPNAAGAGGGGGAPLSPLCPATGIPTPSAPVAIPCGGRARGRAKSAQDLTNLHSPVRGGTGGVHHAGEAVAAGGGECRVEVGGEGVGRGPGFGAGGGCTAQRLLLLGEQQQVCLAPSSAPAAPRGMLGQLLGANKRLPTAGGAGGGILGARGGVGVLGTPNAASSSAATAAGGKAGGEGEVMSSCAASVPSSSSSAAAAVAAAVGDSSGAGTGVVASQQQRVSAGTASGSGGGTGSSSGGHGGGSASGVTPSKGGGHIIVRCPGRLPYNTPTHPGGISYHGPSATAALSCSPQLPFAFTPSAHSFTASAMGVPAGFSGSHPAGIGGQLGLSHQGAHGGSFALALQMASPPVSGVRDISNLATIRRPSWSSRSSSFDVAASASLPHHFSGGSGYSPMAELLEPALLACSVGLGADQGGARQHRQSGGGGEGVQGMGGAGDAAYAAQPAQGGAAWGGVSFHGSAYKVVATVVASLMGLGWWPFRLAFLPALNPPFSP